MFFYRKFTVSISLCGVVDTDSSNQEVALIKGGSKLQLGIKIKLK